VPLGSSLRFLAYLHQADLRNISRSKNIPGTLATAAKKLPSNETITTNRYR